MSNSVKSNLLSLILAITLAGCGDNTAATVTTEGASSTSGDPNLTDGVSQTSNVPTTAAETISESTTGDPLTSTGIDPTSSGTTVETSTTTIDSSTTEDVTTSSSSTTGDVDVCEAPCPDGHVTRGQVAMDMGKSCEELFNPMSCKAPDDPLVKVEAVKVVAQFLEQQGKLDGCDDFMSPEHPDVEMDTWYFQYVQNLHCVNILNEMNGEHFCPANNACLGWWNDLWAKAQMVP